ncbi:unnamed protein product, partial [Closterium sp. NIES-65]
NVSNNSFTGPFPSIFLSLDEWDTKTIDLAHNNFSGPLPPTIADWISVYHLATTHPMSSSSYEEGTEWHMKKPGQPCQSDVPERLGHGADLPCRGQQVCGAAEKHHQLLPPLFLLLLLLHAPCM